MALLHRISQLLFLAGKQVCNLQEWWTITPLHRSTVLSSDAEVICHWYCWDICNISHMPHLALVLIWFWLTLPVPAVSLFSVSCITSSRAGWCCLHGLLSWRVWRGKGLEIGCSLTCYVPAGNTPFILLQPGQAVAHVVPTRICGEGSWHCQCCFFSTSTIE